MQKPRIKMVDGWWRVMKFDRPYDGSFVIKAAKALEWCRKANSRRMAHDYFGA